MVTAARIGGIRTARLTRALRPLSTSSMALLAKSYQLPTVVLGERPGDDVAALCARASESAFFRQGMPLVLDYSCAPDSDGNNVQQHLAQLRAQHLLPVGVANVGAPTAQALASAGVPMLFAGGAGAARTAPRGAARAGAEAEAEAAARAPPQAAAPAAAEHAQPEAAAAQAMRVHYGSLRTGEQLYVQGSSVCVLGSVHSGAELLADGHIVVCGEVSGRVFCGQAGDAGAQIVVTGKFDAELVAVAGVYMLGDTVPSALRRDRPLVVTLRGDALCMEQDGKALPADPAH